MVREAMQTSSHLKGRLGSIAAIKTRFGFIVCKSFMKSLLSLLSKAKL